MGKVLAMFGIMAVGILLLFVWSFIIAWPVMLLWNWLVPTIFGLTAIGYWQAWGLYILACFLVKGTSTTSSSK